MKICNARYGKKVTRKGVESDVEKNTMSKEDEKVKWYLRPISVILSLFFILGPFGLPLLYRSPKFSRKSKIILTIAVVVYMSYLIFISFKIARELFKRIEEIREILG